MLAALTDWNGDSMASRGNRPNVYEYLDYRLFLKNWFAWKKKSNPRYSHRLFARRADQRSPSLLLHVVDGRRNLTQKAREGFCAAMALGVKEARFFGFLVELDQAETPGARSDAMAAIMSTRRFLKARQVDSDYFKYFSRWFYSAIRELARREDFKADPSWVAYQLVPSITKKQAKEALDTLLDLGMLAPDASGVLRVTESDVVTAKEVRKTAVVSYHVEMLERATEAVRNLPGSQRHVVGFSGAIPSDMLTEIKEKLNDLVLDVAAYSDKEPHEQVYHLELAFFPLSKAT